MVVTPLVRGWKRTFSGDGVVLSIPEGRIQIRPSITPLRPIAEIWPSRIPAGGQIEGPMTITNADGDYGVIVNATSGTDQVTVAILYGEYAYTLIEGHTNDATQHATFLDAVRRLAHEHSLGLGIDRRRPYFYDPPPGWSGIARPASTLWLAPDCGVTRAVLEVFHSRPNIATIGSLNHRRLFQQLPREYGDQRPSEPMAIKNRFGMQGQIVTNAATLDGVDVKTSDAALIHGPNLYLLRLETPAELHDAHLAVLVDAAVSVRPLPVAAAAVDVLIEWF